MDHGKRRCAELRPSLSPSLFCLFFALGAAGCVSTVDTIKEMRPEVDRAREPGSSPAWQSVVEARTADIMELLDPGRLLVGTLKLKPVFGSLRKLVPGELILLDTNSGATLWSVPRSAFSPWERQVILAAEPKLLVGSYKGTSFGAVHALDPATGRTVWQAKSGPSQPLVILESNLCVLTDPDPQSSRLTALRIEDGAEAWHLSLPGRPSQGADPPRLKLCESGLLVEGGGLALLDPATGRLRWRVDPGREPSFASETGDGKLLVCGGPELVSHTVADGAEAWSWTDPAGASILSASLEGTRILVLSRADAPVAAATGSCYVSALDPGNGRFLWRSALPKVPRSAILAAGANLYLSTDDSLVLLDAETGKTRAEPRLPEALSAHSRVADILLPLAGGIAVLRESGIAAYSSDGSPVYRVAFAGAVRYGSDFVWKQYEEALLAEAPLTEQARLRSTMTPVVLRPTLYSQAAEYQKYVYQTTAPTLRYGSQASSSERMSAINRREMAARNTMAMGRAEASLQLTVATAQLGVAIGQAIVVGASLLVIDGAKANMELRAFQATESSGLLARGYAGNLVVRPEYENGWRLRAVDLASGGSAILPLSPPNESLRIAEAQSLSVFAVDGDNSRIYALGLGFDPSKYKTYSVIHPRTVPGQGNRNIVLPYPSVMRFDLPRGSFGKTVAPNAIAGFRVPRPGELELVDAAIANDPKRIEALLASGAPIDSSDRYGKTALMHASEMSNLEAIKLLLKKGADLWLADCQDWTAYDYLLSPLLRPAATVGNAMDVFIAAKNRQRKK